MLTLYKNKLMHFKRTLQLAAVCVIAIVILACDTIEDSPELVFTANQFEPFETYANWCYLDHQLFFIRSLFLELYYWGDEIVDLDPRTYDSVGDYFEYLVSDELVDPDAAPDRDKDPWSFYTSSQSFGDFIEEGREISFGFRLVFSEPFYEGDVFVAFALSGSSADEQGIQRGDQIVAVNGIALTGSSADDELGLLYPSSSGESIEVEIKPLSGANRIVTLTSDSLVFPPLEGYQVFDTAVSGESDATVGYLQFNDHTDIAAGELVDAFASFADDSIDELVLDLRYNSGGRLSVANLVASMIAPDANKADKYFARVNIANQNADREFFPENELVDFFSSYNNSPLPQLNLDRVFVITGKDTCSASEVLINGLRGIGVEVIQIGNTTCGKPYGFFEFSSCGLSYLPVAFKSYSYNNSDDYDLGFTTETTTTDLDIELEGCMVEDDFNHALGDDNEARLAAAIGYVFDSSCPPIVTTLNHTTSAISQPDLNTQSPKNLHRQRRNTIRNIMIR